VFWGYVLTPYAAVTSTMLLDSSRLAIVFDLDETLLIANSSSTLEKKIADCQRLRSSHWAFFALVI